MDLEQFESLAGRARADQPPEVDPAAKVLIRLRSAPGRETEPAGTRAPRGWIIALISASSVAACALGLLGYEALQIIEQAPSSWLDPLSLWVSL